MKTLEDFLVSLAVSAKLSTSFKSKPEKVMKEFGLEGEDINLVCGGNVAALEERIGSQLNSTMSIRPIMPKQK